MTFSLSAVGGLGPLPNLAVGGEAAIAVLPWHHLRVEGGFTYWAAQTSVVNSADTASFSFLTGEGRAGYEFVVGRFEVVPSLLIETDFMRGNVNGLSTSLTSSTPQSLLWLALGGGAWGFVRLTRGIAIRFGLEVAVPLARPTFEIAAPTAAGRPTPVFEPGPVACKGAIGLEVRFF